VSAGQDQPAHPQPADPQTADLQAPHLQAPHPQTADPQPARPPAVRQPVEGRGVPGLDESVRVPTAAQMRDLGKRLAGLLRPGDLVVLSGQLGAGKTTLTQGIGAGLGVRGPVTSPTFVIARVHPSLRGGPDLVHADAYRLGSRAEVDDLDLDTDVDTSVTVVEWGEGLVEDLAASFLEIAIAPVAASAGADGAGAGGAGQENGAGPDGGVPDKGADWAGGGPAATGPPPEDTDETRTVRVVGWGDRWRQAAQATRLALSGAPDYP
jgi:tRNA threonylcarbamoyladenosine biosynthesis protein TsaE